MIWNTQLGTLPRSSEDLDEERKAIKMMGRLMEKFMQPLAIQGQAWD